MNGSDDSSDKWGVEFPDNSTPQQPWQDTVPDFSSLDPFANPADNKDQYGSNDFSSGSFDLGSVDGGFTEGVFDGSSDGTTGGTFGEDPKDKVKKLRITSPVAYCAGVGIISVIEGGIVGTFVGAVHTIIDGYTTGASRQPGFGRYVVASSAASGASFGGWLGAYSASKCMFKVTRGKDDIYNTFGAGTIAGMVGSLRTRNPRMILASGLGSGVLMTVFSAISSPPARAPH